MMEETTEMKTRNQMKYTLLLAGLLALGSLQGRAQHITLATIPEAQAPSAHMSSTSSQIGKANRNTSSSANYTPQVSFGGASFSAAGVFSKGAFGSQRRGSVNLNSGFGGYTPASGSFSAITSTPSLNADGTVSNPMPSVSGPSRVPGTPVVTPEVQQGTPMGDGHWFLLLLAAAFAGLHVYLSRKEKQRDEE